jgi:uncharacterized protein
MNSAKLREMEQLAAKVGHVFIATADSNGQPHIAAAGKLAQTPEKHLMLTEWFCPGTLANLQMNSHLSIVIWDPDVDSGYQIIGELEAIKDIGILDGYPKSQVRPSIPQVERQLLLHVDKILGFKRSPHTDLEE